MRQNVPSPMPMQVLLEIFGRKLQQQQTYSASRSSHSFDADADVAVRAGTSTVVMTNDMTFSRPDDDERCRPYIPDD